MSEEELKTNTNGSTEGPKPLEFMVMPPLSGGPQAPTLGIAGSVRTSKFLLGRKAVVVIAVGVVLLGAGAWYVYAKFGGGKPQEVAAPIDIIAPAVEPQIVDSDSDGLTDDKEFASSTNPQKPDTDSDGLADGDEVNIYLSNPLLRDTDGDTFSDGKEVMGGYSPTKNSLERAGTEELLAWTKAISDFGLHEPSATTLNIVSKAVDPTQNFYENEAFGYKLVLPSVLSHRESADGREVGFFVTGTDPGDAEIDTDPIFAVVAVRTAGVSLLAWAESFYDGQNFASLEEKDSEDGETVQVGSLQSSGTCKQDIALFAKGTMVIALTWSCNQAVEFGPLYEEMVTTFAFSP